MASVQHVYRRGAIFWWRRCLPLFSSGKLDIRLSLRTADRQEARERGAALTAATREVVRMLEQRVRAADARPTEDELQAITRQAYAEKLAQFCDDQVVITSTGIQRPLSSKVAIRPLLDPVEEGILDAINDEVEE